MRRGQRPQGLERREAEKALEMRAPAADLALLGFSARVWPQKRGLVCTPHHSMWSARFNSSPVAQGKAGTPPNHRRQSPRPKNTNAGDANEDKTKN